VKQTVTRAEYHVAAEQECEGKRLNYVGLKQLYCILVTNNAKIKEYLYSL
jgi:hypothetical protein